MPSYSGIWTLQQQMQAKAQSLWPSPPLVPGEAYGGGYFAGQISTAGNGIADYNLVVGPVASAQSGPNTKTWKTSNTATAGTTSVINGPANSAAMNDASHPAAEFCEGLTIGGYSDWYSPAKNELEVCYYNLKPSTAANNTSSGINANAVPARASNYTAGTPAQTSATNFRDTGTEKFSNEEYWSSTQGSDVRYGYRANMYSGNQFSFYKNQLRSVRAVRRVAV
jgi:hypothetical protein